MNTNEENIQSILERLDSFEDRIKNLEDIVTPTGYYSRTLESRLDSIESTLKGDYYSGSLDTRVSRLERATGTDNPY